MTKREKIILSITAVAVLGALVNYLLLPQSQAESFRSGPTTSAAHGGTGDVVPLVAAQLREIGLSDLEDRTVHINTLWDSDPFIATELPRMWLRTPLDTPYRYSGFMAIGRQRIGFIDGIDYREGDWLNDRAYKVHNLNPNEAVLVSADGDAEITLTMEQER